MCANLAQVGELCYNRAIRDGFSKLVVLTGGEALKVTTEDLGDRQVLLTIEVDEKRVDSTLRIAARRVSRQYNIPGFRRGRAPYRVILQRFGREALLQEALDDLMQEIYKETLESEGLEPYSAGEMEDLQLDPLTIKMRVPLQPVVDLADYRELRVELPVVAVEQEQVDAELEEMRQANVVLEPADDRRANMGDVVSFDVRAESGGEPYADKDGHEMVLDAEDVAFAPGFSEQIVGMEVGAETSFTLALPDEETEEQDEGSEATFNVTLHGIKIRLLPELDDDLARTVGDFDTLQELRQDIYNRLEQEAQRQADMAYTEEVIEAMIERATLEYPPNLVDEHVDSMVENMENRLKEQGLEMDDYFKLSGQTEETFRETFHPRAEQNAQRGLVLGELVHREKLDIEEGEIDARIALMTASWGEQAAELRQVLQSPENMRAVANDVLSDKALQRLIAIAKGEAPPLEEVEPEGEAAEEPKAEQEKVEPEGEAAEEPKAEQEKVEPEGEAAKEPKAVQGEAEAEPVKVEADKAETAQSEETPHVQTAPEQEAAADTAQTEDQV